MTSVESAIQIPGRCTHGDQEWVAGRLRAHEAPEVVVMMVLELCGDGYDVTVTKLSGQRWVLSWDPQRALPLTDGRSAV